MVVAGLLASAPLWGAAHALTYVSTGSGRRRITRRVVGLGLATVLAVTFVLAGAGGPTPSSALLAVSLSVGLLAGFSVAEQTARLRHGKSDCH